MPKQITIPVSFDYDGSIGLLSYRKRGKWVPVPLKFDSTRGEQVLRITNKLWRVSDIVYGVRAIQQNPNRSDTATGEFPLPSYPMTYRDGDPFNLRSNNIIPGEGPSKPGIYYNRRDDNWQIVKRYKNHTYYLGSFTTLEEAEAQDIEDLLYQKMIHHQSAQSDRQYKRLCTIIEAFDRWMQT